MRWTRRDALAVAMTMLVLVGCGATGESDWRAPDAHGPELPPAPPEEPFPPAEPFPPSEPFPPPVPEAPYPDVTYDNPGVNVPIDPIFDEQSTFSLDVDTGAYGIARRYLADGNLPDPDSVRVEEFVNAFDGGFATPNEGTFAVSVDGAPAPFLWGGSRRLVRIGIQARDVVDEQRPP